MKILYFDTLSGVSGDMLLGALVDAGADLAAMQRGIDSLGLPACRLAVAEVKRRGFRAVKVTVEHEPEHAHRHLHHITEMIERSALTPSQQELAIRIFTKLGEAEAFVHGTTLRKVHFHEVGAVDSIADIVGTAIALDLLAPDRIVCSPVPTGGGTIEIAHGLVSVPAPATAKLLTGVPLAASPVQAELTTPTGAAVLASMVDEFGPVPSMLIRTIGCGAGDRDLAEQPNVLRVLLGEAVELASAAEKLQMLETNIDHASGEVVGHCLNLLFEAGALDAYTTPVQMKKNRPGVLLSVLCRPEDASRLESLLFRETGTLGVRQWTVNRRALPREAVSVATPWGEVAGKVVQSAEGPRFSPEYEACRAIARERQLPLIDVYEAARRAYDARP